MIKLINSGDFDPVVDVGMTIVNDRSDLRKTAAAIDDSMIETVKPDKNHTGILVVALGDDEHFGANRNGDSFTSDSCEKYHSTFVEHGHVFRHHRNKDAKTQGIGDIKLSKYNPEMGRVELYIHADNEKAAPELARLEKEGTIPFSMACRVPWDRCSICGAKRKHSGDDSECEHVRNHLGELQDDGKKVFTYNDEPDFFDISFVGRPADRIAWDLKVASGLPMDSAKRAEYEGVVVPDSIMIRSGSGLRKYAYAKQLASFHDLYRGWFTKSAEVVTVKDHYLYELRKVASTKLDDQTVSRLREYNPKTVFTSLGKAGVLLDVPTFFKYAMGPEFDSVRNYMSSVEKEVPYIFDNAVKTANCQDLCNDSTFDSFDYESCGRNCFLPNDLMRKLAEYSIADGIQDKILSSTMNGFFEKFAVDTNIKKELNSAVTKKLAEKYAAYKLSALDAIIQSRQSISSTNPEEIVAISATQDL